MAQPAKAPDRLPWLTEVPRTPPPPPAERSRRRAPWGWVAGAAAILGVGAGAYWLGTRQGGEEVAAPATAEVVLPEPTPADEPPVIPSVSDITAADELTAEPEAEPLERPVPRREQGSRSVEGEDTSEEEPAPEPGSSEVALGAPPPPLPLPLQPVVRGRIVQLGAYPTRVQADFAWRAAVKRFPYLASKPRLISPIEVRSTDGKPTRMYRLQLATASQAQSVVVCQQLESARQSCVVVY